MERISRPTVLEVVRTARSGYFNVFQACSVRTLPTKSGFTSTRRHQKIDEVPIAEFVGFDMEVLSAINAMSDPNILIRANVGIHAGPGEWPDEELILTDPNLIKELKNHILLKEFSFLYE